MSDYLLPESRSLKKKMMKMSYYLCQNSRPFKKKRKISYYSPQKSRSFPKKMKKVFPYLPMDIIEQILWRLPVESVVKCTSVCKTWYALIRDPSFISSHLQASAALRNDLFLLRFTREERDFYSLHHDNDAFDEYKKFHLPFEIDYYDGDAYKIVGICNGLICLADVWGYFYETIFLWNPSIHKHSILPKLDCFPFYDIPDTVLGFGFDSISDDYKVLLVFPNSNNNDLIEVWLFSIKRHSWKRVSVDSLELCCSGIERAAFVRGALHWLGKLKNDMCSHMILVLDINTENISTMNLPETLVHFLHRLYLIKYKESIAIFRLFDDLNGDDQLELWVMNEYGIHSSWTKVLSSVDKNRELVFGAGFVDVFGVRKNGEVLLEVEMEMEGNKHNRLATVDLNRHQVEQQQQQQLKHLVGLGDNAFVGSYVESLVLLDIGEEDKMSLI